MFEAFHGPGADKRSADEAQADRLEVARRKHRRRIARPEAVPVARDDRETGDVRIADEIVNLLPLGIGGAIIVSTQDRVGVVGP